MKPIVAIVGRPNVGKSTLFNKLVGRRKAIASGEPGVTRDVNYADCMEGGRSFTLVDTGGFEAGLSGFEAGLSGSKATRGSKTGLSGSKAGLSGSKADSRAGFGVDISDGEDSISAQVRAQATLAIEEADLIVCLMDGRAGPVPQDKDMAAFLRKSGKPIIYVANKIDSKALIPEAAQFYDLGLGDAEVLPVSAEGGLGTGELVDALVDLLPPEAPEVEYEGVIKVAIVGRPNAGKSSLLNKLIGKKRAIVSEVPGTTRDPVDTLFEHEGERYLFIDTAGIRRKNRLSRTVEAYSAMEAIKSIERCDAALLVIDAESGPSVQDERIAGIMDSRYRLSVVVVNKWDLLTKETNTLLRYTERIREDMPFLTYAPVEFISALSGQRVPRLFSTIKRLREQSASKITTSRLNELLAEFTSHHQPPVRRGRRIKLYYITQTGTDPLRFTVFANSPEDIPDSYRRYLVNSLRASLEVPEVPLIIVFKRRR